MALISGSALARARLSPSPGPDGEAQRIYWRVMDGNNADLADDSIGYKIQGLAPFIE